MNEEASKPLTETDLLLAIYERMGAINNNIIALADNMAACGSRIEDILSSIKSDTLPVAEIASAATQMEMHVSQILRRAASIDTKASFRGL